MVAPGEYTLRLSANQEVVETQALVIPDPRIEATSEEYAAQQVILKAVETAVREIHNSVNEMRKVKKQLLQIKESLKLVEGTTALQDSATAIVKKITTWEEALIQPNQKTFQDVINFPNKLNAELIDLKVEWMNLCLSLHKGQNKE
ncbi:MAG: hypothetical protein HC912_02410 [Saprospiraceae bacterium]|nr:hypothetical protein [Saprospiraceae bacterium]